MHAQGLNGHRHLASCVDKMHIFLESEEFVRIFVYFARTPLYVKTRAFETPAVSRGTPPFSSHSLATEAHARNAPPPGGKVDGAGLAGWAGRPGVAGLVWSGVLAGWCLGNSR